MTGRAPLRALLPACLMAFLMAGALHCGGEQQSSQPRASMDLDGGSEGAAPARPRRAPRSQQAAGPVQVTILSLKDIPMPPTAADASGAAGAEPVDDQDGVAPAIGPAQPAAIPGKGPGQGSVKVVGQGQAAGAPIAPSALAAPAPDAPPPRNLFAFEEDPQVVMTRRKLAEEAAAQAEESRRQSEDARFKWQGPPLPPPPPQPPAISFQFIGYMGTPEDRIGVFLGPGTFLAKNGEVVQGKFKILSIGYESAEIGFTGFSQTQRIPMTPGGK